MKATALGIGALAAALLGVLSTVWRPEAEPRLISVATGSTSGVYYLVGGALCAVINEGRWRHGTRCESRASEGSVANLRALRAGTADLAIVQSDALASAWRGADVFEPAGPDATLRTIARLYAEPITLVTRPRSDIASFQDLRGMRVNIGPPGSGGRATVRAVFEAMGWTAEDFAHLSGLAPEELPDALCDDTLDAALLVIAHPNRAVEEMLLACETRLAPTGAEADALLAGNGVFFPHRIPGTAYPGLSAGVDSLAVAATLTASSQTLRRTARLAAETVADPRFRARLAALVPGHDGDLVDLAPQGPVPPHAWARALRRREAPR